MKVEIGGAIRAANTWWNVNFTIEIDDKKSPAEKIALLTKTIEKIAESGHVVTARAAYGSSSSAGPQQNTPSWENHYGGSPAFTWPPPTCEIHREDLVVSKQQNKPGKVAYYCPKRLGDAYCNKRCTVDEASGKPSYWEVKK